MDYEYTIESLTIYQWQDILGYLDEMSILKLRRVCSYIKGIVDHLNKPSKQKLLHYCESGKLVSLILVMKEIKIEKYLTVTLGSACKGGHRSIIVLLISKGANAWNAGLRGACEGGDINIVRLILRRIEIYETTSGKSYTTDLNGGLRLALVHRHKDIATLLLNKGARINDQRILDNGTKLYYKSITTSK